MQRFIGVVVLVMGGILLPVVFQLSNDLEAVSTPGQAFINLLPFIYILTLLITSIILIRRPSV